MARSYFAIERPRRISISIEGYTPDAQTLAQQRKQEERRRRLRRKVEAAASQQAPTARLTPPIGGEPHANAEELDALNSAAACRPSAGDCESELRAAFADDASAVGKS